MGRWSIVLVSPHYHCPMPDLEWIRKLCLSLPGAAEDMPWEDTLCFKVRKKIFAILALSEGRYPRITLKCAPDKFHEALEIDGISPAPYLARYKWIMLDNPNVVPSDELEALIRESYELVEANAPKKSKRQSAKRKPSKRRSKKS
jgi:predicted DNA-binding protein (MmcQ/YjbR family)